MVGCPAQAKSFCDASHLADRGNCAEEECDHAGDGHSCGQTPKPPLQLFNKRVINVHKICCGLVEEDCLSTVRLQREHKTTQECLLKQAHPPSQRGEKIQKRKAAAPTQSGTGTSQLGGEKRPDAEGWFWTPSPAGRNDPLTPKVTDKNVASRAICHPPGEDHPSAAVCSHGGGCCQREFCLEKLLRKTSRKRLVHPAKC